MWNYEKRLQYPVNIKNPNPALAKFIISQYGGPDGELGASLRYLSQRYSMPYRSVAGILTDVGTEEIGWMCILGAAPFAACGFFTYHGMTAEQVLWAWFKSEILCPKRLVFRSDSYYYEAMQPAIRAGIKRKRGLPMKKNTHDSEETA